MRDIFSLSLRKKIFMTSSITVIVLIIFGLINYKQTKKLSADLNVITETWLPGLAKTGEMKSNLAAYRQTQFEVLSASDQEKTKLLNEIENIKSNLSIYNKVYDDIVPDSASQAEFDHYKDELKKYNAMNDQFKEFVMAKKYFDAEKLLAGDSTAVFISMNESVKKLAHMSFEGSIKAKEETEKSSQLTLQILMYLIPGTVLFSILLNIYTSHNISKKLLFLGEELDISSNDLNYSAHHVVDISHNISSTSQQQAAAIEQTSASLQELTSMVDSNLTSTKAGLELAEQVKASSLETFSIMKVLNSAMTEIQNSNDKINHLVQLIENIGEKTELIDEIVFQTKLLSFNASVEAERAGEHGRGFAVVAQEVGNLAGMSGKSALEISSIVRSAIHEARQVGQETKERVSKGSTQCEASLKSVEKVIQASEKIFLGCQQVLQASQEQAAGIREINSSVQSLNQSIQNNAATAEESAASGSQLVKLAEDMSVQVEELYYSVTGKYPEIEEEAESEQAPLKAADQNFSAAS